MAIAIQKLTKLQQIEDKNPQWNQLSNSTQVRDFEMR